VEVPQTVASNSAPTRADYQALAAFRHALRRFLAVSQGNASSVGLTPQQHQALLSIKAGFPEGEQVSIGDLADHLLLRNHSTVELVGRLCRAGLVERRPAEDDRRRVLLALTAKGEAMLAEVTAANLDELHLSAPIMTTLVERLGDGAGPVSASGRNDSARPR
jgi:DNA-binding MarR family transcriptional regulator